MPRVHYDSQASPVSPGPEAVSADRWLNQRPDPIPPAMACVAALLAGAVLPAFSGHEVVNLDKWFHQQPEPIRLVSPATVLPSGGIIPAYTGPEIVLVDKWWKQQPEPIRLVAPSTTLPSGDVWPVFSGHEVVLVCEWLGWQPDGALRPQERLIDLTQSVEPSAGALSQSKTSVDRWYQQQPHRGIAVQPFTTSAVFYAAPVTLPASVSAPSVAGWAFNQANPPQTRLTIFGYSVGPVSTAAEATSVDRWIGLWRQPFAAKTFARADGVNPPYVQPPIPIFAVWPQPNLVPRARLIDAHGAFVAVVAPPAPLPLFGWYQPIAQPVPLQVSFGFLGTSSFVPIVSKLLGELCCTVSVSPALAFSRVELDPALNAATAVSPALSASTIVGC